MRIFLFSSRVRRVYFGGGYFHHRNRSSGIAAVWCAFQHLSFRYFRSGDKPPQWRENFAYKSGCNGGKVRCNCAAQCVDLKDSTPVLLSWIVLVWLSPLDFLSHRTSDIAPARGSSPAYSRSPVYPSRCHGGRTLLGNGYSVVMRKKLFTNSDIQGSICKPSPQRFRNIKLSKEKSFYISGHLTPLK